LGRPAKSEARADARGELIAAAWQLFSSAGYDATTVNAILAEVGLSKGAFYYYFSGKEDILDAVVGDLIDEMARAVEPIPSMSTLSPVEKLKLFIETIGNLKLANIGIIKETVEVIYRDENAIIRNKMNRKAVESLSPILAEIINEGTKDGVFAVDHADDAAEMLMHFSNAMGGMQADAFKHLGDDPRSSESILRRAQMYMGAFERILGAPAGSLDVVDRDMVEEFEQAVKERGVRTDGR
jgi:AcrR family transcriptional regulator